MTHDEVIADNLIDKYIRNKLGDREKEFEEHLLECPLCFEEVKLNEHIKYGIEKLHQEGFFAEKKGEEKLGFFEMLFYNPAFSKTLLILLFIALIPAFWGIMRFPERGQPMKLQSKVQVLDLSEAQEITRGEYVPIKVTITSDATTFAILFAMDASYRQIPLSAEIQSIDKEFHLQDLSVDNVENDMWITTFSGRLTKGEYHLFLFLKADKKTPIVDIYFQIE